MQNRNTPRDEVVSNLITQLDAKQREDFEERAGIIEYEARVSRAHAECLALLDVLRRHPSALTHVCVLHAQVEDSSQWLLTTNLDQARLLVTNMGGIEIAVLDVAIVLKQHYAGLAVLSIPG